LTTITGDLDGWEAVTDRVMGGVSNAALAREELDGRTAVVLRGTVSLENNGGFIQMARDLGAGRRFDASGYTAIALDLMGDGGAWGARLRTDGLTRPWQSYAQGFEAPIAWTTVTLPLRGFEPHRTDAPFDPARLRRLGLIAIGEARDAWLALSGWRWR